jgi:cAMP-dependent protein kinase regulator
MPGFLNGLFSAGKHEKELKELQQRAAQDPRNIRLQVRIGDLQEKMGKRSEALEAYRRASEEYARKGFLIQAIAVSKLILRLDPAKTGVHDQVAALYAEWGKAAGEMPPVLQPESPPAQGAGGMKVIPLFSDLKKEELSRVMEKIRARSASKGERVCREGDAGDSIYIISRGRMTVSRNDPQKGRMVLGELKEGDFFGEFGFFSNSRRQASVEADAETELLEITREDLQAILAEYPSVSRVLFKFYKDRVLDNLLASSPLFQTFSPSDRREVLKHLTLEEIAGGISVVEEGTPGDCLYIIKSGEVEVFTVGLKGERLVLARLKEGDYFGEISLLTGRPRTASVTALRRTELVRLGKKDFDRLAAGRPEILKHLEECRQARMDGKLRMLGVCQDSPAKEGMI